MRRRLVAVLVMLAVSATGVLARSGLAGRGPVERPATQRIHVHQCCHPDLAPKIDTPPSPENMPCGGHHSCCLRPGPGNVANVPALTGLHRLRVYRSTGASVCAVQVGSRTASGTACAVDFQPYAALTTVIRI